MNTGPKDGAELCARARVCVWVSHTAFLLEMWDGASRWRVLFPPCFLPRMSGTSLMIKAWLSEAELPASSCPSPRKQLGLSSWTATSSHELRRSQPISPVLQPTWTLSVQPLSPCQSMITRTERSFPAALPPLLRVAYTSTAQPSKYCQHCQ